MLSSLRWFFSVFFSSSHGSNFSLILFLWSETFISSFFQIFYPRNFSLLKCFWVSPRIFHLFKEINEIFYFYLYFRTFFVNLNLRIIEIAQPNGRKSQRWLATTVETEKDADFYRQTCEKNNKISNERKCGNLGNSLTKTFSFPRFFLILLLLSVFSQYFFSSYTYTCLSIRFRIHCSSKIF